MLSSIQSTNHGRSTLIRTLKKLKTEDQANVIQYLNTEALDIVGECFHNIVSTDLKLKKSDKKKLKNKLPGNEKIIKFIAKKSNCPEKRRRKLLQSGIVTFCIFIH